VAEFIRIVRVRPNGSEQLVRDIPYASLTDSQAERAEAFADARSRKAGGQHIRVYTSSNEQVGPGDVVWDSTINL
jgi:hypothetical protein